MTKLPKNTLSSIPRASLQEVLKNAPDEIDGVKEYVRDYISDALQTGWKQYFSSEDFDRMIKYIDINFSFLPRIQKLIWNRIISLVLLEKMVRMFADSSNEDFERLCENEDVRDVIVYAWEENLERIIALCKSIEDFERLCNDKNTSNMIKYARVWNFQKMIALCKSIEDFERLCRDEHMRYLFKWIKEENLKRIWELYNIRSIEDFERISKNKYIRNELEYLRESDLERMIDFCKGDVQIFERLCKCIYINGELDFTSDCSLILWDTLEQYMIDASSSDINKYILGYFRKQAQNFLDTRSKVSGRKTPVKKDISLYVRYWHTVDYPEIAEAVIIFVQEYRKYFSDTSFIQDIRIIPYRGRDKPNTTLFQDGTMFYDVRGREFESALHDWSIAVFLSHSTNSSTDETVPNIISAWMEYKKREWDIILPFELEKDRQQEWDKTKDTTLDELFEDMFHTLQSMEDRLSQAET